MHNVHVVVRLTRIGVGAYEMRAFLSMCCFGYNHCMLLHNALPDACDIYVGMLNVLNSL